MKTTIFRNLPELTEAFPDEKSCRIYLEEMRWNGKPQCPHCEYSEKIYVLKDDKGFKCSSCKKNFSLTKGTIFERTHIPLRKWFIGLYLFSTHKKGISSHQLARDLGITQPNAWFMEQRMRKAMNNNKQFKQLMKGIVEVDETFIGGKNKNRHWNKRIRNAQGRSTKDKAAVVGLMQRGGNVITFHVKKLKRKTIQGLIRYKVKKGSVVSTDEYKSYNGLDKRYTHGVVNHGAYQYCNGEYHTNSLEGYWSWIKRGLMGIYHRVSKKYLFRYCDEYDFRYNTRGFTEHRKFETLLSQFFNSRLTLNDLSL